MNEEFRQFIYKIDEHGRVSFVEVTHALSSYHLGMHIRDTLLREAELGEGFLAIDAASGDVLGQWSVQAPHPSKELVAVSDGIREYIGEP